MFHSTPSKMGNVQSTQKAPIRELKNTKSSFFLAMAYPKHRNILLI
ncbi:hypothetical protein PCS8203_01504 [Streptococcus pneumoniae PCS8203]|nr:hypothetical protein PCS8106_02398 [Streptococcus pneumoniae PCS8106]ELU56210.1 hypothetical protein PCS8203_01504 [Streptococcus pneumoniae PCS8203]